MLKKIKKDIIFSIIPLFIIGCLFHYLFKFSNNNILIGLFCPINESVWEHLKLLFIPTSMWYYLYSKSNKVIINKDKWFNALLISLFSSIISMILLYYSYTGILGFNILICDIAIFIFSIIIGQSLSFIFYKQSKEYFNNKINFIIFLLIFFIFTICTFNPPKIPLFTDLSTILKS